jgi:hypothetical protein
MGWEGGLRNGRDDSTASTRGIRSGYLIDKDYSCRAFVKQTNTKGLRRIDANHRRDHYKRSSGTRKGQEFYEPLVLSEDHPE